MAIPVLVIGRSGSGKTYSLKNFKADDVSATLKFTPPTGISR